MKNETLPNLTLPKIGYGAWRIGGNSSPDRSLDEKSLSALRSALEVGYTHFDTAEMYADGRSEELIGRAIREFGAKREDVFITSKVTPNHLQYDDVLKSCENSLRRLQMDYLDLYLVHWPHGGSKYDETFKALNKLVRDGKVKHLGVSNFNLKLLKLAQSLSETPIVTNQVPFSLADRSYVKNGVLEYCQQNDILFTAYSPVDEGNLRESATLEKIAKAHRATLFQIALAWIVSHPRVIAIPMSFDPVHIKENFDAAEIELDAEEIKQLEEVRE
ncbi:MAG: aldo/keto reductase [Chloroflexi bacterium]|nr:aldo/keto reductase [Chloroflexi bacterium CFX1]MCK6566134.1 aldo/keto reductase [Anaerolineales bacterium]MCQ3952733.1 aldo/keto reductase [Chloroflexota bacterium]MDL1920229.1 aldo/keto reductase [Chloroflexi bacterium CFX5]RIK52408.1 MAG: aldo/keto reductase [Chloroflexota bacterium]